MHVRPEARRITSPDATRLARFDEPKTARLTHRVLLYKEPEILVCDLTEGLNAG